MKRIFILLLAIVAVATGASAKKMSDLKIYINPGHGGYTGNDRPIQIYPFERNDTAGYWESTSNLYKGLHMYHILDSLGAKPYLSRIKNTEDDDRSLSGIAAEANNLGVDLFFSIHSNAGENVNTPLMLYRENEIGVPRYEGNVTLSKIMWKNLYSSKLPIWTRDKEYVVGDLDFYQNMWQGGLGVLRTLYVVGLLSEGSMHEHRPEAHRLMNDDVLWLEAWHFVKSIMEYYDTEDRFVNGNVAGIVYDDHNLREFVQPANFTMFGRDANAPLNGSPIELVDDKGNVVQTRTTDNMYNGAFVFRNVAPGNYTVRAGHDGYYTLEKAVTVTANEVTYQDMPLTLKREFPFEITAYSPKAAEGELVSCSETLKFEFNTDVDVEAFEAAFNINPALEGYFTYSDSYRKAEFHPALSLERNTHYTITIAKSAKHTDANYSHPGMNEDLVFEFTTLDRNRLELLSNFPADGGEIHMASPTLEFRFDATVDSKTIFDTFKVTDSNGKELAINTRNTGYNKLSNGFGNIIYALNDDLEEGKTYTVTLDGELRDRTNLPLGNTVSLTFTAIDATHAGKDAEVVETFEASTAMFSYSADDSKGISGSANSIRSKESLFGTGASKMNYKFASQREGVATWKYNGEPVIFNNGDELGVHINGDFNGHELQVLLTSGTDVKVASLGELDFRGWNYRTVKLDMLEAGFPYVLTGMRLVQTTSPITQNGSFIIDNITRVSDSAGVSAVASDDAAFQAWPIPATDVINASAPAEVSRLTLINAAGATVATTEAASIDVTTLSAGVYFLHIESTDGREATLRVAIR
ncbi:MAG: Ig-like domain-containing protein [Muribaculaceae bacterium]|nr:Ig-like domain-containing protein [Muribaculaceae bacterium]